MIRKFLLCVILGLMISAQQTFADILPYKVSDIPAGVIGLYQVNDEIVGYAKPDKSSKIIYTKKWSYLNASSSDFAEQLFAVLIDKKELGFVYANDIDEDFVQIICNKDRKNYAWAYKEDSFQFLPWITFFNMYGKKYGLKILKESPVEVLQLHSKSEVKSQIVAKLSRPKQIRLTTIQGNWALVTVLDNDGIVKTGYIRWRSDNGDLYLFPAIR